ncbi:4-(cytidine 5'-diphospho)-2-C-methyl-D-erythritol kinase [bacterium]|nr:4-(cytidine 5'-diphospho)-2-C-methyl-D-erythritol kinase [bacterium]
MTVILTSPAKINLFLKLEGNDETVKRHRIRSLMVPVSLSDRIIVAPSENFSVVTRGISEEIPSEKNIVFKSFTLMEEFIGRRLPAMNVVIEKKIPTGAGLGGGSSNAATFLLFLNEEFSLGLNIAQISEVAAQVGSDVPFFLYKSAAVISGFGETIQPVKIPRYDGYFTLVYPNFTMNTALAYSLFDQLCKGYTILPEDFGFAWDDEHIFNDFESVVFDYLPRLKEIKGKLVDLGAERVFMSGSGSTLIAMTKKQEIQNHICEDLKKECTVHKIDLFEGCFRTTSDCF